jgi:VCBS repeat-containing protein
LTPNGAGSFSYTPNSDFDGSDSFTYHANDGLTDSNVATVSITINPVNDPPVANAKGHYAATVGVAVQFDGSSSSDVDGTMLSVPAPGVLGNDSDPDGDGLVAKLVSDVSSGTLTLNGHGSFIYTPEADFNGSDSFTYTAYDGTENSNVARVTITVTAANDSPVAGDDT